MVSDVSISATWEGSDGAEAAVDPRVLVVSWLIVLLPLLSLAVMGALAARRNRRRRCPPPPQPAPDRRDDSQPRPQMTALQLVAVETSGSGLVIDCVVADHDSPLGPIGWPVSFRVRKPQTPGLDEAVHCMLARWAEEDEVVGFASTGIEPWRRVSITHGTSVLTLDPEDDHAQ